MMCELFLPLAGVWFDKIESGEKKTEFRIRKPYWSARLDPTVAFFKNGTVADGVKIYTSVRFSRGYSGRQITFKVAGIDVVNGLDSDLRVDAEVYAIRLGERL